MEDGSATDSGTQSIEPVLIGSPIEKIETTYSPLRSLTNKKCIVQCKFFVLELIMNNIGEKNDYVILLNKSHHMLIYFSNRSYFSTEIT
jgi:hypothetical protein